MSAINPISPDDPDSLISSLSSLSVSSSSILPLDEASFQHLLSESSVPVDDDYWETSTIPCSLPLCNNECHSTRKCVEFAQLRKSLYLGVYYCRKHEQDLKEAEVKGVSAAAMFPLTKINNEWHGLLIRQYRKPDRRDNNNRGRKPIHNTHNDHKQFTWKFVGGRKAYVSEPLDKTLTRELYEEVFKPVQNNTKSHTKPPIQLEVCESDAASGLQQLHKLSPQCIKKPLSQSSGVWVSSARAFHWILEFDESTHSFPETVQSTLNQIIRSDPWVAEIHEFKWFKLTDLYNLVHNRYIPNKGDEAVFLTSKNGEKYELAEYTYPAIQRAYLDYLELKPPNPVTIDWTHNNPNCYYHGQELKEESYNCSECDQTMNYTVREQLEGRQKYTRCKSCNEKRFGSNNRNNGRNDRKWDNHTNPREQQQQQSTYNRGDSNTSYYRGNRNTDNNNNNSSNNYNNNNGNRNNSRTQSNRSQNDSRSENRDWRARKD